MVNINKYIKALLHPAGGHQGSHKAHQAGNLCVENSPGPGEFPAQIASNAENVSILWRHHDESNGSRWRSQNGTWISVIPRLKRYSPTSSG